MKTQLQKTWRNFNFWFWPFLLWPLTYFLGDLTNFFALGGFIGQLVSPFVLAIVFAYYASKFGHNPLITIGMLFLPVVAKIAGAVISSHIPIASGAHAVSFPFLVLLELTILFIGYALIYFFYKKEETALPK